MTEVERQGLVELSLLAGQMMLENGAETSRVEDTMERMIQYGLGRERDPSVTHTYVTVNGIFVQLDHRHVTNFRRVDVRSHDLGKVTRVNQISRSFTAGDLTLEAALQALKEVAAERKTDYAIGWRVLATAVLSGSVMLILGGAFRDLPAAILSGVVCYFVQMLLWRKTKVPFLSEYAATFIGGSLAYALTLAFGGHVDAVMIGTVAPLVPGIAITTAIRDIMAKHYLSGMIRGLEGIFVAGALGTGIATVYYLFIL